MADDDSTLCQHREDGQICIRMRGHEEFDPEHVMRDDTQDEKWIRRHSPLRALVGDETPGTGEHA